MNSGVILLQAQGGMAEPAQVLIAILPLVSVVMLSILAFFFMFWDHKKRILIIQKGDTPTPFNIDEKLLLLGIVALFTGLGLVVFSALYSGLSQSLLGGIIPASVGGG
ncbi:MAG: hypothetical protein JW969_13550, partial [Spirochaetales bacterium]|nr:hypothetical protein [Spirochaetales bacterium]